MSDLDDLLAEVEGVVKPKSSSSYDSRRYGEMKSPSSSISSAPSEKRKNELDDLLKETKSSSPTSRSFSTSASSSSAFPSSTSSIMLTTKNNKCINLYIGGDASKSILCQKMRCLKCDFEVMRFKDKRWASSVDYMFFRNNVPTEEKLKTKLESALNTACYCCQCTWRSVSDSEIIRQSTDMKWSCCGH